MKLTYEPAFANRGAYQNVLFVPSYTLAENDAFARKWAGEIAAKTKQELNRMLAQGTDEVTKDGVGEYLNYAGKFYFFSFLFKC